STQSQHEEQTESFVSNFTRSPTKRSEKKRSNKASAMAPYPEAEVLKMDVDDIPDQVQVKSTNDVQDHGNPDMEIDNGDVEMKDVADNRRTNPTDDAAVKPADEDALSSSSESAVSPP